MDTGYLPTYKYHIHNECIQFVPIDTILYDLQNIYIYSEAYNLFNSVSLFNVARVLYLSDD